MATRGAQRNPWIRSTPTTIAPEGRWRVFDLTDTAAITLTHDANGNLTFDGLYDYRYDALNRLVEVTYGNGDPNDPITVAEYEYDGMNRRIRKHVQNFGEGVVADSDSGGIDGIAAGNRHEHHYYAGWRVIEERDASANVLAQTVYSTEYIDAPLCRDRNTDYTDPNDAGADACLDSGGSQRYFYHQDVNYRVLALTDENGDVVERYDYAAYGEPRIFAGGATESGRSLSTSSVGNPYMHQGLRRDDETGLHENRLRAYSSRLGRFVQRDPVSYVDSMNLYEYVVSNALSWLDPLGLGPLSTKCNWGTGGEIEKPRRIIMPPHVVDPHAEGGWVWLLDLVQGLLDAAGFWGPVGPIADAGNAAISAGRGNWADAGLNAVAAVPLIGDGIKAAKMVGKAAKAVDAAKSADNAVAGAKRVGSALKNDPYHAFPDMIDNFADKAKTFPLSSGGTLHQLEGSYNGVDGVFEWIVKDGKVVHRFFVPGGAANGIPIRP